VRSKKELFRVKFTENKIIFEIIRLLKTCQDENRNLQLNESLETFCEATSDTNDLAKIIKGQSHLLYNTKVVIHKQKEEIKTETIIIRNFSRIYRK